ncbi:MAG: polyprenol phosphomannose-dependent alpha 1,6 mannosyltransferase MptB, partial [Micrococcus sp.]|nr:polyprenol phosphomannose-dependent alpha 1,6 mannosyltransferase MptB [Micrococcus sp.]
MLHRSRARAHTLPVISWFLPGHDRDPQAALRQGLLGSLLVMIGSWGVGWLPSVPESLLARFRPLTLLRLDLPGVLICAIILVLGAMLLVRSWFRLGQQLRGRWDTHGHCATRAAWWWSVPLLFALPIFSRDVYSYIQQGRMVAADLDPYAKGVSALTGWFMQGADTIWAESPSPYGPLFLWLAEGVWTVSRGVPEVSVTLFRLIAVAGMAVCLWAVPRLARAAGRTPGWAVWVSVTNPLFLLYMVAAVHNDSLMMGLMLAGFVLLVEQPRPRWRALAGVGLIALSIAIKPLTILMLPFVALLLPRGWVPFIDGTGLRRRDRIGPWITTALIAAVVLAAAGLGSGLGFGWFTAMMTSGQAAFPYAPFGVLGIGVGWLISLLTDVPARTGASWFYTAGTVAVLAFTAWCALRRRAADPVWTSAAVLFVAVVLAPIIQPWYLVWLLPLVACCLPLPLAHHRWLGWVLGLSVLLLTGVGVVDQLAVNQWLPLAAVRVTTAVVAVGCIVFLVAVDPHTRVLFPRWRAAPREVIQPCVQLTAPQPEHAA